MDIETLLGSKEKVRVVRECEARMGAEADATCDFSDTMPDVFEEARAENGRDPIWWTGCLRCRRPSTNRHLILHRTRVAQHRVASLRIVEASDVLDDRSPGPRLGWPTLTFDQLALQSREEAFSYGVVPAITLAAHAADDAVAIKLGTVVEAGVLAAAV